MIFLLSMQVLTSYKQYFPISLLIGVVLGVSICLLEVHIFRLKSARKYKPTVFPYLITWIILFLNIVISKYMKPYLLGIFAAYLITLALLFKIYEIRTNQKAISWNELLQENR